MAWTNPAVLVAGVLVLLVAIGWLAALLVARYLPTHPSDALPRERTPLREAPRAGPAGAALLTLRAADARLVVAQQYAADARAEARLLRSFRPSQRARVARALAVVPRRVGDGR